MPNAGDSGSEHGEFAMLGLIAHCRFCVYQRLCMTCVLCVMESERLQLDLQFFHLLLPPSLSFPEIYS